MVIRLHCCVVAFLILIAGCGDANDIEGVAFSSLSHNGDTESDTPNGAGPKIATADTHVEPYDGGGFSGDEIDVGDPIQQTGYSPSAPSDVQTPPTSTDPFASDPIEGSTPVVEPGPFDEPPAGSRELTPMERMLQQRAAAIAKANGQAFDPQSIAAIVDDTPREMKLLVAENSFREEGPDKALRVTFDDLDLLKILNMSPVPIDAADHFPEWLQELHGKKVRVRGFMYPTMRDDGIKKFRMARDNDICCFVKTPKIYDTARIQMKAGVTASYIQNLPFDVVGTFHISPKSEFGDLYELWRIDDAVIIKKR